MLLKAAPEQIPHADEVRTLIKDIWDIRLAKLYKSVDLMIKDQEPVAQIDNLTLSEMNQVRTLLLPALDAMHDMRCYVTQLPSGTWSSKANVKIIRDGLQIIANFKWF